MRFPNLQTSKLDGQVAKTSLPTDIPYKGDAITWGANHTFTFSITVGGSANFNAGAFFGGSNPVETAVAVVGRVLNAGTGFLEDSWRIEPDGTATNLLIPYSSITNPPASGGGTGGTATLPITVVTASLNYASTNSAMLVVRPSSNVPVTITLPGTPATEQQLVIKGAGVSTSVTINGNGNLIDSDATVTFPNSRSSYTLIFDGTVWLVI